MSSGLWGFAGQKKRICLFCGKVVILQTRIDKITKIYMKENSLYDKKSIRAIVCEKPDWNEIAKDCVAFTNAQGGIIDFGIEDDSETPPIGQRIDENLPII